MGGGGDVWRFFGLWEIVREVGHHGRGGEYWVVGGGAFCVVVWRLRGLA